GARPTAENPTLPYRLRAHAPAEKRTRSAPGENGITTVPTVHHHTNQPEVSAKFVRILQDIAANVFKLSVLTTVALFGYLLWGLFSGQLTDATQMRSRQEIAHILQLIPQLAMWLNISLIALVGS